MNDLKIVYINKNKYTKQKKKVLEWWNSLDEFTQFIFIQAFQLKQVSYKEI